MFYIEQLRTSSFPIRLAKTESGFIVRSVDTGLERSTLVVAVTSVDAYPTFGFLRPDLSPWGYRDRCFLVALCHLIVRRLNLEVATKRLLHQQVKTWKSVPTPNSGGVDISEILGCHFLGQMSSQWGPQKSLQGSVSHELRTYLSIFNLFKLNELWLYYRKHINQVILTRLNL